MHTLLLAALALQAPAAGQPQTVAPRVCTAQPNQVSTERLAFDSSGFRFTGHLAAPEGMRDDFVPAAVITLAGNTPPEELSIYLAVRGLGESRYAVTRRRVVGGEMREREVLGGIPSQQGVDFTIEVAGDQATFQIGTLRSTVPLNGLRPTSVDLSCASGTFRFDNLAFVFSGSPLSQMAAATPAAASANERPGRRRLICRTSGVLGSRISRQRLCLTQAEWDQHDLSLGQMRRDIQNRNPGTMGVE